jgi:hypothetical protein
MHKHFTAPSSEVLEYSDVIVDGNTGLIVRPNGSFVEEQADEVLFWRPTTVTRAYKSGSTQQDEYRDRTALAAVEANKIHEQRSNLHTLEKNVNYIYMAHPFGWHAFGHFFDSTQRLFHTLDKVPQPFKVLHSRSLRIVEFEQHLEKLGVPKECLIEIEKNQAFVVPSLWVSPWQATPANLDPNAYDWIYKCYTQNVTQTKPLRLYLSRNHVRLGERSVQNEAEVLAYLKQHGFQVLRGDESLQETLSLFHNAEMIIAPHGSSLANTMFCKESCRILEFCPDNRVDQSFKRKHKKAQSYSHVQCVADSSFNINIPMDIVKKFLSETIN